MGKWNLADSSILARTSKLYDRTIINNGAILGEYETGAEFNLIELMDAVREQRILFQNFLFGTATLKRMTNADEAVSGFFKYEPFTL